ncbi:hypothetical protein EDB89DRAFT_1904394 [Lactarius sanguifluus]|nr:hypothetical protein EDB89DRAFT_1904394 [Lactarius sanguifluus]
MSWGLVVAALHAMLRWCGRLVGSCTTWRGLGMCWVGVAGGVGAGRGWALCAMLKGCGGSAGSWRVLGRGGGESVGGGVLRAVLGWRGGRWRLGLACCVEVAWWVGGVLACRVGLARWVGGGGVAGQDGGGSRARMGCNLQGLALCWGGEVGWQWRGGGAGWGWLTCTNGLQSPGSCAVLGRQGGLAVVGCQSRMEVACVHEWR